MQYTRGYQQLWITAQSSAAPTVSSLEGEDHGSINGGSCLRISPLCTVSPLWLLSWSLVVVPHWSLPLSYEVWFLMPIPLPLSLNPGQRFPIAFQPRILLPKL